MSLRSLSALVFALAAAVPLSGETSPPPVPLVMALQEETSLHKDLPQELLRLAERLGIEKREGQPRFFARHVLNRLEPLTHQPAIAKSEGFSWFPQALLRDLILVINSLGPDFWSREGEPLSERDRSLAESAQGIIGLLHEKLDRLEAPPPAVGAKAAPPNDLCSSAVLLDDYWQGHTNEANTDGSASCGASASSPDVWFRYVAPADGVVTFDTYGTSYDSVLSLHTGCPGDGGTEIACSDDSRGTHHAQLSRLVAAGEEIWARLSGHSGDSGMYFIRADIGGGIAGRVSEQLTGEPLEGASVAVYILPGCATPNCEIESAVTGADGSYLLGTGGTGNRYVIARYDGLVTERYDDISCVGSCEDEVGTPVAVAGALVSAIDLALAPPGSIAGSVTASSSLEPQPSGFVYAYTAAGTFAAGGAITPDGSYQISDLPAGSYKVHTGTSSHADEVFTDRLCDVLCDVTEGDAVTVVAGATTPDVDFALAGRGAMEGIVSSALAGEIITGSVEVFSAATGTFVTGVFTEVGGSYRVDNLQPGSYVVSATDEHYVFELFDDCALCSASEGDPVSVLPDSVTSEIDFVLDRMGIIWGTVREKGTGNGLRNERVSLGDEHGFEWWAAYTDFFGRYAFEWPRPGDYRIWVHGGSYQREVFDDLQCAFFCEPAAGTPVSLELNTVTSGIDFNLSACGFASHWQFFQDIVTWTSSIEACETITLGGGSYKITPDGDLTLRAGRTIILRDGFAVESGGRLTIEIDPKLSGKDD